jgi:alpha-D-xyloside xylohydrolase
VDARPDYDYAEGTVFEVFELEEGAQASVSVPAQTGQIAGTATVMRTGESATVETSGGLKNVTVRVR